MSTFDFWQHKQTTPSAYAALHHHLMLFYIITIVILKLRILIFKNYKCKRFDQNSLIFLAGLVTDICGKTRCPMHWLIKKNLIPLLYCYNKRPAITHYLFWSDKLIFKKLKQLSVHLRHRLIKLNFILC